MFNVQISRPILDPTKNSRTVQPHGVYKTDIVTYLLDSTASDRYASRQSPFPCITEKHEPSYVSVTHGNGVKGLVSLILEGKCKRELSCSTVLLKMLLSQTQYRYLGTLPLCQDCIYTYFMSYCCKYWRKISFILFFLFPRLSPAL